MKEIWDDVPTTLKLSFAAGVLPFFITFYTITYGVYRNYTAIIGGAVALIVGLAAASNLFTEHAERAKFARYLALVLALGLLQLARGFGLI